MEIKEQLKEWVKGNSIHNAERDECTPDFSCCNPPIQADLETRLKFEKAYNENDEAVIYSMLNRFLAKLLSGIKVSGDDH